MNRQLALLLQPPTPSTGDGPMATAACAPRAWEIIPFVAFLWACLAAPLVAQNKPSEKAMAAYADAANFQNGGATELAIEAWNQFLATYPEHPMAAEAAHFLGVCYMQQEDPDYEAASRAFTRALKNNDYDLREESLVNQGWCLYSAAQGEQPDQAKLKKAIATYEVLRKENPESRFLDRALFYSGESAYGLGQAERAIEFYNQLLSLPTAKDSPLRCDALYARGVAHEELDQFDEAFASYKQLLSSCDRRELIVDVHLRSGDLMILRKDFGQALQSLSQALEMAETEENRAYAMFRRAFALVQSGQAAEAAAQYEQLIAKFPNSPFAAKAVLASAQSTYRSGDIDQAAKRFRKVLSQNDPGAATEAAHWLARIEIAKGRPEEAIRVVNEQLKRGAEGTFAMDLKLDLAEALSMNPDSIAQSMKLFEQAYRDAPRDALAPRALYNAAFSALQINQPQRAIELATEFLSQFPDDTLEPDVQYIAAEGHLQRGNAKQAADTYQKLLASTAQDHPQRPAWLLRAGACWNAAGEFDQTLRMIGAESRSLRQPAQRAEAQLLIGQAQLRSGKPAAAAKSFLASRDADPDGPRAGEAVLLAGQAQMASGDATRAEATWNQLVKAEPDSRMADQARYKLAKIESDNGNLAKAIQHYQQILQAQRDPGLIPYVQYGMGWALMQSNEYQRAVEFLDQMLRDNKQHPLRNDATLARGITLRNLGRLREARTDLESYLAIPPTGENLGHALYELALIDQQAKQPGQAALKLERLVKEVPDYPSMEKVLYELGWSLQESGNDDGAVRHFTTLISRYPGAPVVGEVAYFVGQKHYAAEKWEQAAEQFELAAGKTDDPKLSEKALYRLGWSRFKQGDFQAAEKAFASQAAKHGAGRLAFDADMMVGECRFKKSEYQQALQAYEVARDRIRKNNDSSRTIRDAADRQVRELIFLHGGQSAAQQKAWDTAIEWYDELRERFPSSDYVPQIFYETGFAYQQKGDHDKAIQFYQQVADKYRNELAARARFMMGEIYFANKEFDKAIPEFQRVMFGFGADQAPARIKNWQAKSGFEAARCSELLLQVAKTADGKQKALRYARDFYTYVVGKHPQHELAAKSRERLEALRP